MARDELEKRIARLESRMQLMEDRRKALIPPELEDNPHVKMVLRDSLDGFTAKLKAWQRNRASTKRKLDSRQRRPKPLRNWSELRWKASRKRWQSSSRRLNTLSGRAGIRQDTSLRWKFSSKHEHAEKKI